jgi:lysophospholipase L1-like esterase
MRRRRRTLLIGLAAGVLAACGAGEAASPPASPSTVGNVGNLPGELSSEAPSPPTTAVEDDGPIGTTFGTDPQSPLPVRVGELAEGNRLLVLGDSILEATSTRYGGEMCLRLVPHGWAVDIDAENGRDAGVGLQILEDRLDAGEEWDAAVVMLGNNYRNDPAQFEEQIEDILDLLAPAPVLLLTVTEFEDAQAEVNYVLHAVAAKRDDVRVVDWAARTRNDDSLTGADGLHLSERGKVALLAMVRLALGDAPNYSFGQCLED